MLNTDKIGPMGWGEEHVPNIKTLAIERRISDEMHESAPERFSSFGQYKISEPLLNKLKKLTVDYFDKGFTLYTRDRGNSWSHNMTVSGADGVYLPLIEQIAFGQRIKWLRQLIGSCVASGAFRALVWRSMCQIIIQGYLMDTLGDEASTTNCLAPFAPYHYWWGRKYSGISGNGDGSTCQGQIRGLMNHGFLPCSTPGLQSDAFPEPQSTSLYRRWGANGRLAEEFEQYGKVYDLLTSHDIESADDAKRCIAQHLEPSMVCSGWAFKPSRQMPAGEYSKDPGKYIIVDNSWGWNAHRDGPHFVMYAEEHDQWCRSATMKTMGDLALRKSDTLEV